LPKNIIKTTINIRGSKLHGMEGVLFYIGSEILAELIPQKHWMGGSQQHLHQ
jgi:hypothetical protein